MWFSTSSFCLWNDVSYWGQNFLFHSMRMIHNNIFALIRIYYFSWCILHQTDGSARQNVCHARKKIYPPVKFTIQLFINRTHEQDKIKQVEKRFFAKTSNWNPFQAYQLELRIIYPSCNTKYDKRKHTVCFSIHSERKCFSLSWNKSTKNILLLLSTLYRKNPLIQEMNSFATLDYYIPSTVTDFKKNLSQISFWI